MEAMEADVSTSWYMINYGGAPAYIHEDYVAQDNVLISNKYIRRRGSLYISANTRSDTLTSSFVGYSGTITVRNAAGAVISGSTYAGAGGTVTLSNGDQVTLYLKGDVNGDGSIGVADYTNIRLHILRLATLSSFGAQMADVNGDDTVDISDYTLIRLYILGLRSL